MVDPILASRRSFLKLLGGAAAVLAAGPAMLLVPESPVLATTRNLFPPNVLHVMEDGVWRAVLGVRSANLRRDNEIRVYQEPGRLDRLIRGPEYNAGEIEFEGLLDPNTSVLLDTLEWEGHIRPFSLSLSGISHEFSAFPIEFHREYSMGALPIARLGLSVDSDITVRTLET
jgi:hypothetical protein